MKSLKIKKQRLEIISALWKIVKLANNEEIAMADLAFGIPDGETPEDDPDFWTDDENFKDTFKLYSRLARRALKDGLYLDDHNVYSMEM